jgi:single-stranded-DNA-specific exonuclease
MLSEGSPVGASYNGGAVAGAPAGVGDGAAGGGQRVYGRGVLKRWAVRTAAPGGEPAGGGGAGGGAGLAERVLAARGVTGAEATAFLDPRLSGLHDPSLIPDLDRAAERLLAALEKRELVVIYGDYDVDGITASAILFHMFRLLKPEAPLRMYVPHRVDEGYGLNSEAISHLADQGARVIVSVDCGVTAVGPASVARARGVDLIITDHHNPPQRVEDLPAAYAVVHPRRPDSAYPFGELSGAGVAYKLAWRLATLASGSNRASPAARELLVDLLGFAALGAIADVVPLVGENRVIARFGLARLRTARFTGLAALIHASRLDGEKVSSWDVGFKLAPRLNASGRLAHAQCAVELLTDASEERARQIAGELEGLNAERKAVEREIFTQACQAVEAAGMDGPQSRGIVLADERWHTGVVGIVCSRLVERYARPAILLGRKEEAGVWHGSGRSVPGVSLHAMLERCGEHLRTFGGHDMAAGLSLHDANVEAFRTAFVGACNGVLRAEDLVGTVLADGFASLGELSVGAVDDGAGGLGALEPYGAGNPRCRLIVRGAQLAGPPQLLGRSGEHVALTFREGSRHMRFVAWRWNEHREHLTVGRRYDVLCEPKVSRWGGNASVEPELVDLLPL